MATKRLKVNMDDLIQRYLAGESGTQLARAYGVSWTAIYDRLRDAGIPIIRHSPQTVPARRRALPLEDIIALYETGWSMNALSHRFAVARTVLTPRLLEAGIALRGQSAAEALKWSQMSAEQRARQVAAAHAAVLGHKEPLARRLRTAQTLMRRGVMTTNERRVYEWLCEAGLTPVPQQAIGPYNCDLGICPIAVEIFGGNFHGHGRHATRLPDRLRYLADAGWSMVIIHTMDRKYPLLPVVTQHILTARKEASSNPPIRGRYWMIRGTGELAATGSMERDHGAIIQALGGRKNP